MKNCVHCGKELLDEAVSCPECGCPVNEASAPETGDHSDPTPEANSADVLSVEPAPEPEDITAIKKGKKKKFIIALVITLVLAIVIVCIITFKSNYDNSMDNLKSIIGNTYVNDSYIDADVDLEYEFKTNKTCIKRVVDRSGYTEIVEEEKEITYKAKYIDRLTCRIEIENFDFTLTLGKDNFSLQDGNEYFFEKTTPVKYSLSTPDEAVEEFNKDIMGDTGFSSYNATNDDYINSAVTVINNILKSPSTAVYNSCSVYEKDSYGRAIVKVDVTAENSFGGAVRSVYYVCIKDVNYSGEFLSQTYSSYVDSESDIPYLKSINDFGKHPNEDESKDVTVKLKNHYIKDKSVEINENTYECISAHGEKVDLEFYTGLSGYESTSTNPDQKTVVSVAVTIPHEGYGDIEETAEMIRRIINSANGILFYGGYTVDEESWTQVFDPDTTKIITEDPLFLKGGFIVQAKKTSDGYVYTVTLGRYLGCTETCYWTPVDNNLG